MTMTERDLDDLLRRAAAEIDNRITNHQRGASVDDVGGQPARQRAWPRVTAVAAFVSVGVGGVAVLAQRDVGPASPVSQTGPAPSASAPPPHLPLEEIDWQRAVDLGSLARSEVSAVTAGPTGFLATGVGFDDGRNQGRVWFSVDGATWEEPALDLFDAKQVRSPAALADAYFVLAQSNNDRLGRGEGAPPPGDLQLYRSVDGRTWQPWGEPWGDGGYLASTGAVLLRQRQMGPDLDLIEWSADGLAWHTAEFPDGSDTDAHFDLSTAGVTTGNGVTYLRGFHFGQRGFAIWTSSNGTEWRALPAPPAGGPMIAIPDGVMVVSNERPTEQQCQDLYMSTASVPPVSLDTADSQWACTSTNDVFRYDQTSNTWRPDTQVPADTPNAPVLLKVGSTAIAAVTEPGRSLAIWSAPLDHLDWQPHPETRLAYTNNAGSPSAPRIAASHGQAVVITARPLVDGETAVLVGTLR